MSFGTSMRFESRRAGDGPVPFWQLQDLVSNKQADSQDKRPKKKFNTKAMQQKHPLRNKAPPVEEVPPKNVVKKPRGPQVASRVDHRPPGSLKRNPGEVRGTAGKNKSTGKVTNASDEQPVNGSTVTLTKDQLNTILETIGQLTNQNRDLQKQNLTGDEQSTEKKNQESAENNNVSGTGGQTTGGESIFNLGNTGTAEETTINWTATKDDDIKKNESKEPAPVPEAVPPVKSSPQVSPRLQGTQSAMMGVPVAHMTKAEKKRLQWERERAEASNLKSFNPWGRPGAGAPLTDGSGNVLADYNNRKDLTKGLNARTDDPDSSSVAAPQQSSPPKQQEYLYSKPKPGHQAQPTRSPPAQQVAADTSSTTAPPGDSVKNTPEIVQSDTSTSPVINTAKPPTGRQDTSQQNDKKAPPAAIRSSFAIGFIAPDEDRFKSAKQREKEQWLADLEIQREEKRLQKQKEKQLLNQTDSPDTWAQRMSTYKHPAPQQQSPRQVAAPEPETVDKRISSAPTAPMTTEVPQVPNTGRQSQSPVPSTFLRGQHMVLDSATRQHMEDRKKKNIEHQEAIRRQIEERDLIKKRERERRIREEQEEEAKFMTEKQQGDHNNDKMQRKKMVSQDERDKQLEQMKKAIDDAKEQAEWEKHKQRIQKLRKGGHDITHLHASYEAPEAPQTQRHNQPQTEQAKITPRDVGHVEPTHVPGLNMTPRVGATSQAQLPSHTEMITPNMLPLDPATSRQEGVVSLSRDSTDIIFTDDINNEAPKEEQGKKARNTSANKKKSKTDKTGQNRDKNAKPRWGYSDNNKSKKPVKQSERDPNYERKTQKREALKALRQKELLEAAERQQQHLQARRNEKQKGKVNAVKENKDHYTTYQRTHSPPVPALNIHNTQSETAGHQSRQTVTAQQKVTGRGTQRPSHRASSPVSKPAQKGTESVIQGTHRPESPPVPAMRHQLNNDYNIDSYSYRSRGGDNTVRGKKQKYADDDPTDAPKQNGDFVPFVRTNNILDPAKAEIPMPVSREPTSMERARQAYVHNHKPANYGAQMENIDDRHLEEKIRSQNTNDPIFNPGLLKDHPTTRQDQILQQLSDLRRGLMQKQRELEFGLAQGSDYTNG